MFRRDVKLGRDWDKNQDTPQPDDDDRRIG
jgi:hypothetical protein